MNYDVVVAGAGPAGLSAALTLGRSRRRALVCDAGPRRNARAARVQGFVTRDGTPPDELRRLAREQLARYASIEVRDARVEAVAGERDAFEVRVGGELVTAQRVLLCLGVIDELPDVPGLRELWGASIFQCPYCHGWEHKDGALGLHAPSAEVLEHASFLTSWSRDLTVFVDGAFEVAGAARAKLEAAGVRLEAGRIARYVPSPDGAHLVAVEVEGGRRVPCDAMFYRPKQRQTDLVANLALELDGAGYVRVSPDFETSRPGVFAAGDLTTMAQAAIVAAADGMKAVASMNRSLVPLQRP